MPLHLSHPAFILTILLLAPPICGAQLPGDIDDSGTVEQIDATLLADHLLGSAELDAQQLARADCNGQYGIDAGDLVWIVNHDGFPVPAMVSVPAGSFEMGDPWGETGTSTLPVHTVTLSAYEIGQFEVTNAECAAFLNSALASGDIAVINGVVFPEGSVTDSLVWTLSAYSHAQLIYSDGAFTVRMRDGHSMGDHPVVTVSWRGAAMYCNWLSRREGYQEVYTESGDWPSDLSRNGYHLPTEAQWERAAAWEPGHGHWRYGFRNDTISPAQANCEFTNPLDLSEEPYTSPAGHFSTSTSAAGCFDMSGNVFEWCNDWFGYDYYSISPEGDPVGPVAGTAKVLRGGSWYSVESASRSATRAAQSVDHWSDHFGFRLARNP